MAKRPLVLDGTGPWPPNDKLPPGWQKLKVDEAHEPNWSGGTNPWDPFEPKEGPHGRLITLDSERIFRVDCGEGWDIKWDDMFPDVPPPVDPPTSVGCDAWTTQTARSIEVTSANLYLLETECRVQLTWVVTYKVTYQLYECEQILLGRNAWRKVGGPTTDTRTARRTSIFKCPC